MTHQHTGSSYMSSLVGEGSSFMNHGELDYILFGASLPKLEAMKSLA